MANFTTITSSSTAYWCTLSAVAQRIATTTTSVTTSTYGIHSPTPTVYVHQSPMVNITDSSFSCIELLGCALPIQPNPDIAGVGVIAAFLATACITFMLVVISYIFDLVPSDQLNRIDSILFRRQSRNASSSWRDSIEEISIIFSDQQLVTGLGILIAGFWQAANSDLDFFHWNYIIYLAWISSTVHLMSISLLRQRFNANKTLRNIRVAAMLIILGLLCVSLSTTITQWHRKSYLPVSCLWSPKKSFRNLEVLIESYDKDFYDHALQKVDSYNHLEPNSIVSYVTLISAFSWKIVQLFASSRSWLRHVVRTYFECQMEQIIQKLARRQSHNILSRIRLKVLVMIYIIFVLFMDIFESFVATMVLLAFTLIWGGLNLIGPQEHSPFDLEDLRRLTFGQVLSLLLFSQPILAAIGFMTSKKTSALSHAEEPSLAEHLGNGPKSHSTLNDLLRDANVQLLNSDEKVDREIKDTVIEHVYTSRIFRASAYLLLLTMFVWLLVLAFESRDDADTHFDIVAATLKFGPGSLLFFLIVCLAWSKRLFKS